MTDALREYGDQIAAALQGDAVRTEIVRGELILWVKREAIVRALTYLRDDPRCLFKMLADLCGVDYPERPERFEVVYNLLSLKLNRRIRVAFV